MAISVQGGTTKTAFYISNRLVVPNGKAAAGGLDNVLQTAGDYDCIVRLGWSGETLPDHDFDYAHPENHVRTVFVDVSPENPKPLVLHLLDLPEAMQRGHYNITSNGILWPAAHGWTDLIDPGHFKRTDFRESIRNYHEVNRIFAMVANTLIEDHYDVINNDYQMRMVGLELRKLDNNVVISHQEHIPPTPLDTLMRIGFADAREFAKDLMERALFAYDFVGVQAARDLVSWESVLSSGEQEGPLGVRESKWLTNRFGERVLAGVSPVTIDAAFAASKADSYEQLPKTKALIRAALAGRQNQWLNMVAGDRLDYTKFLTEKLLAIRLCIEQYGVDPRTIHLTQAAPAGRKGVPGYAEVEQSYIAAYESLRADYGNVVYTPHDQDTSLPCAVKNEILLNLYRYGEIALFASGLEGFHVGIPEAIAVSRREAPCTPIFTELKGCFDQYRNAGITVSRPTPKKLAGAIMEARGLTLAEKQAFHDEGTRVLTENTGAQWINYLTSQARIGAANRPAPAVS